MKRARDPLFEWPCTSNVGGRIYNANGLIWTTAYVGEIFDLHCNTSSSRGSVRIRISSGL